MSPFASLGYLFSLENLRERESARLYCELFLMGKNEFLLLGRMYIMGSLFMKDQYSSLLLSLQKKALSKYPQAASGWPWTPQGCGQDVLGLQIWSLCGKGVSCGYWAHSSWPSWTQDPKLPLLAWFSSKIFSQADYSLRNKVMALISRTALSPFLENSEYAKISFEGLTWQKWSDSLS